MPRRQNPESPETLPESMRLFLCRLRQSPRASACARTKKTPADLCFRFSFQAFVEGEEFNGLACRVYGLGQVFGLWLQDLGLGSGE